MPFLFGMMKLFTVSAVAVLGFGKRSRIHAVGRAA